MSFEVPKGNVFDQVFINEILDLTERERKYLEALERVAKRKHKSTCDVDPLYPCACASEIALEALREGEEHARD